MKSLLFLTDLDQPALVRLLTGVERGAAARAPDAASAAADWLGIELPAPPAYLRLQGEQGPRDRDSTAAATASAPDWLACMDPVSMAADMRELHLLDDAPVLDMEEAAIFREDILPSLEERGFSLRVEAPGRWYVSSRQSYEFTAASPAVARAGRIRDELADGPDARLFRALGNEIQMLWHDHPVNIRRARQGLPPVNAVWLWGAGPAPAAPARLQRLPPLCADEPLLTGLWDRLGGERVPQSGGNAAADILAAGCVMALPGEILTQPDVVRLLRREQIRIVTRDGLSATLPGKGLRGLLSAWRRR